MADDQGFDQLQESFARAPSEPASGSPPLLGDPQSSPGSFVVPPGGRIPVAFVISRDAEVLDFTGPLEVFASAYTAHGEPIFQPYVVATRLDPVTVGGGLRLLPDHTFATAPTPNVMVIPAMRDATEEMLAWIRASSPSTDVTMAVCNGAFVLAATGLLDGRPATAHHGGYFRFAGLFPNVQLKRGARFVETGNLATSGGVSAGIDLALRVVGRYLGRAEVLSLVDSLEYQGQGWLDPDSNQAYAPVPASSAEHPICPLCRLDGDRTLTAVHRGVTYFFCSEDERSFFEQHPEVIDRFLAEDEAFRAAA